MKLNNKGFTLVELLAVIVILAVVMLIGVTAVGPLMARSRKGALGTEGLAIVKAAQTAFQAEQLKTGSKIVASKDACFSVEYLKQAGYYEKGDAEHLWGSVLVDYNNGKYTYSFWILNDAYGFANEPSATYNSEKGVDATNSTVSDKDKMQKCGGSVSNTTVCSYANSTASCS